MHEWTNPHQGNQFEIRNSRLDAAGSTRSHLWEEAEHAREVARQAYFPVPVHIGDVAFHFALVLIQPEVSYFNLAPQYLLQALKPDALQFTPPIDALLNSCGAAAWQTVFHFHVHVIPRYHDDPLRLPWVPSAGDPAEIAAAGQELTGG